MQEIEEKPSVLANYDSQSPTDCIVHIAQIYHLTLQPWSSTYYRHEVMLTLSFLLGLEFDNK